MSPEARRALDHLPAAKSTPAELHRLAAWFAAHRQGRRGGSAMPWNGSSRPIRTMAPRSTGWSSWPSATASPNRAAELRARKTALDQLKARYKDLFLRNQPAARRRGDGQMAEQLGHWLRGQGLLPAGADDETETAMTSARRWPGWYRATPPSLNPVGRLAELLAPELAMPQRRARSPSIPSPAQERLIGLRSRFEDDAAQVGLTMSSTMARPRRINCPNTQRRGRPDRFRRRRLARRLCAAGRPVPARGRTGPVRGLGDRLFRNRGDGTFEDVDRVVGPARRWPRGYGHGVAVGDYDNDGHPDLFVTRWRSYALYRNRGDGTFEDVTAAAGLGGDRDWPTSAAFADLDNDGDLDLYVCHYLKWDADHPRLCQNPSRHGVHQLRPARTSKRCPTISSATTADISPT